VAERARKPRADAQRNRENLILAARAALTTGRKGEEFSLEAVALAAGVGIATLYRNFPTREDLVLSVYRQEVAALTETAAELLETRDADIALREWMDRFAAYVATKRGMAAALQAASASDGGVFPETYAEIVQALSKLVAAGVDGGKIRSDVGADDVMRAMNGLWQVGNDDRGKAQARLLLNLLMDGLRTVVVQ
jgi:AcrR family transcriptional regulator